LAIRAYENFDLRVADTGQGAFRAVVTQSPSGSGAETLFSVPFDDRHLTMLLETLDPSNPVEHTPPTPAREAAAESFGSQLFEAVFAKEVGKAWFASQTRMRVEGKNLRLRLGLTAAPALAGLPWEFLHDPNINTYLAQMQRTSIVRFLDVPYPEPVPLARTPLRVLVVISDPSDLTSLDVTAEWQRVAGSMQAGVADGDVVVDQLPARMPMIRDWLEDNEVHILHFIGHGEYDPTLHEGFLYFTDEAGMSERVRASRLGTALGAHDPLRLVVLNACRSGWARTGGAFNGLAQGLIQQGCVAVVAMQFPISDEAAAVFAETFYRELVNGSPIDKAVVRSRQALMDREQTAVEWATPVVFLRSDDSHIFRDAQGTSSMTEGAQPALPVGAPATSIRPLEESGEVSYQNFDISLEARATGDFRAQVLSSPVGEGLSTTFALPFGRTQLENLLLKCDPDRFGRGWGGADTQTEASKIIGTGLFDSVFVDDIRLAWSRSEELARAQGGGLRLRLRLADAPSIAGLPWELLYDRRSARYIGQSQRSPIVRYVDVSHPPRPLAVTGPLRVAVLISAPPGMGGVDVDAEWRQIQHGLAPQLMVGQVRIDRVSEPSLPALAEWLSRNEVHILHVAGHGDFDPLVQEDVLYLEDRDGRANRVGAHVLGACLRNHHPLRLVLLNTCRAARVDAHDPFSGMAQRLVEQDCSAVVAMQFPLSEGAAGTFVQAFYRAIVSGLPVDLAATVGREALSLDYPAEWATPVLFMRSPDGRIFERARQ
jgi:CHAT domain-containing protein